MRFSECHSAPINMLPTGVTEGQSRMEPYCSECYEPCEEKDMSIVDCDVCEGEGQGVFSCCTGKLLDPDEPICPKCKEVLGESQCVTCRGTGKIQEDQDEE